MHRRDPLITLLERYQATDDDDFETLRRLMDFVRSTPDCMSRHHPSGHVTASAWIVDPGRTAALLVHHRKLDRWLQPGGHVENDPSVLAAARREVAEETGLDSFETVGSDIFDLDIHSIPARRKEPEHLHYDVRFLFVADPGRVIRRSEESHDLRWFSNTEIRAQGEGRSIDRMIDKATALAMGQDN